MKATLLLRERIPYSENAFAELVLWLLPKPLVGSAHKYKYRLAFVVDGICVVRYDNEQGKGDHRHFKNREYSFAFDTPEQLLEAFQRDIERIQHENRNT